MPVVQADVTREEKICAKLAAKAVKAEPIKPITVESKVTKKPDSASKEEITAKVETIKPTPVTSVDETSSPMSKVSPAVTPTKRPRKVKFSALKKRLHPIAKSSLSITMEKQQLYAAVAKMSPLLKK